jgi:regulatory protein
MRITGIEPQKRRQNRYSIYVDGEFAVGVNEETLFSFRLKEGTEIEASILKEIAYAEEKQKAKEQALNLLSYRARSKKELMDRLKQKGAEIQCINEVLNELSRKGVPKEIIDEVLGKFNELELAQNIAEKWLSSHKHLSQEVLKRRLFGFLARRGISYDTIKPLDTFRET